MFSAKLERRRKARRFALLIAATVLLIGLALFAVLAGQGVDPLGIAGADRRPLVIAVLGALAGLLVFSLIAYASARIYGRVTMR